MVGPADRHLTRGQAGADSAHNSPTMTSWQELVQNGAPVVADGAMGTMLMANGLAFTVIILLSLLLFTGRRVYGVARPVEAQVAA